MQAQFGKDVLGTVRLDEARKHRDKARQLREDGGPRAEMKDVCNSLILSSGYCHFSKVIFATAPWKIRMLCLYQHRNRNQAGSDMLRLH